MDPSAPAIHTVPSPFGMSFQSDMNPIEADQWGMEIVDKLDAGRTIFEGARQAGDLPAAKRTQAGLIKLKKSLDSYLSYKKARKEEPFSYEPEAKARKQMLQTEQLARSVSKLYASDDTTFRKYLEEQGDAEDYDTAAQFMPEGFNQREDYIKRKSMKMMGFSDREIDSGFAEPLARDFLKAGENEPTIDAFSRWSLDLVNQVDRKHKLGNAAAQAANMGFLAMDDSEKSFEEALSKASPDISDSERRELRAIRNHAQAEMEKAHGNLRPLIRKAFNTFAMEEGITPKFKDAGVFNSPEEAVSALTEVPDKQFPTVVAMLAATAEAHGQEVPGFMTRVGKNFTRGVSSITGGFLDANVRARLEAAKRTIARYEKEGLTPVVRDPKDPNWESESDPYDVARLWMQGGAASPELDAAYSIFPDKVVDFISGPGTRHMTPKEFATTKKIVAQMERSLKYRGQLNNWRDAIATVNNGKWYHPSQWAYTLAGSIPEMATVMLGPAGMSALYMAETERNMVRFQAANPTLNPEKARLAAQSAAAIYTLAARAELDILFKKIPGVKNVYQEFAARTLLETVQESVQDLSFPVAQAAYAALDDSMPDVQLMGKDGAFMETLKQAPKTAFAVLPLVALGMGGHRAAKYMDRRQLNKLLKDTELLSLYGLTDAEIQQMKDMSYDEAVKFMEGKNPTFTEDSAVTSMFDAAWQDAPGGTRTMSAPMADPNTDSTAETGDMEGGGVTVHYSAESDTFNVTNGSTTLSARTSAEAVEAARSLDPKSFLSFPETTAVSLTEGDLANLTAQATAALNNPNTVPGGPQAMNSPAYLGGDPVRWTLAPTNVGGVVNPVGHPELTRGAEDILRAIGSRTAIRFSGRKVSKRARGVYWLRPRIIRVRRHAGVTTVFHEVGHAIEDQFLEGGIGDDKWIKIRNASPELARELDKLGNDLYQGQAPPNTTMSEGFAEYTRMLLEGVHDMEQLAPHTHKWFTDNILSQNPHIAEAYAKTRAKAKAFAEQGAFNRGLAGIVRAPGIIQKTRYTIEDIFNNFAKEWVDILYPLKDITAAASPELEYELAELRKKKRPNGAIKARIKQLEELSKIDPFATATRLSLVHDAIVKYMVQEEMRDWAGNGMGAHTSLASILAPFKGDMERRKLAIYLWARRTLALASDGKGRETGLSVEDAMQIFTELDSPLYERTAQRIYEWNDSVLEYAAQSSADFAEVVKRIREIDPGCYIPLLREFQHFDRAYASSRSTPGATGGKLVHRMLGSSRRIKDPFTSMISQARAVVLRANQRAVIEQLLKLSLNVRGLGDVVFEVGVDNIPAAHRTAAEALDQITRVLEDPDSKDAARQLAEMLEDTGEADALITFWGDAYMPPNNLENPIIPVFLDGKRRWFEVNRTAYDALMGMEVFRMPSKWVDVLIGGTNRMFKLGTTGYRASFSMITNPARDLSTLYHNTRSTAMAPRLVGTWANTLIHAFIGALSGGKYFQTEWDQLYRRLGLEMATPLGQDTRHTEAAARKLFQGKVIRLVHPYNVLEYIRDVFQYAEAGARITEMKLVARDIGWDIKDPLTPEVAAKLAMAAKQVTTDFTAAGRQMRWINQIMPFSNAQIQGVRSHYDAFMRNPTVFIIKGMMKASLAISIWLQYKDEDWWIQMPTEEKYRYTYIPMGPDPDDEVIRIPRSFEVDGFFMGMPIALLDAWNQDDPKRATEWAKQFTTSFIPTTGPVLLTTPVEMIADKDLFFNRPIVPEWEKKVFGHPDWKHLQYGSHTTRLSIKLGEMFDVSPRMIDHAIKKFTGGAGIDAVALLGRGPAAGEGQQRESQLSDIPVVGTLFSPVGKGSFSPRAIDDFYDRLDWADGRAGSLKLKGEKETPEERRMRLILRDAASTISVLTELSTVSLTVKERREFDAMKLQVAKDAVQVFDSKEGTRAKFKKWKAEAEKLRIEQKKKNKTAAARPDIPEE